MIVWPFYKFVIEWSRQCHISGITAAEGNAAFQHLKIFFGWAMNSDFRHKPSSPWGMCVFKRIGSLANRDHHREILHSEPSSFCKHAHLLFWWELSIDFYCFYSKLMIFFMHTPLLTQTDTSSCCAAHSGPPRQKKEICSCVNDQTCEERCNHA